MTFRLSFFVPPPLCLHDAATSPAAFHSSFASGFSDYSHANSRAVSLPSGAGNFSYIRVSISYQSNKALQQPEPLNISRGIKRNAFHAVFTRNGHRLIQTHLSRTPAEPCMRHT